MHSPDPKDFGMIIADIHKTMDSTSGRIMPWRARGLPPHKGIMRGKFYCRDPLVGYGTAMLGEKRRSHSGERSGETTGMFGPERN